jgi:group I intron endonuclease
MSGLNGRFYIGSAANPDRRWTVHKYLLAKDKHQNHHLQNAWNLYGPDAFSFFVVEDVPSKDSLLKREQDWLDATQAVDRGYNILRVAGSTIGLKHSDETRAKMSAYRHSDETKAKIGEARKGKVHSPETKAHFSATRKGRKLTEEHRRNMAEALRGRTLSPETKAKISAANKGQVVTPETRAKLSASQKGRPRDPDQVARSVATRKAKRLAKQSASAQI